MPISRPRKKVKKKKGPTPKNPLRDMKRTLALLEQAEKDYANQQNNDEEHKNG